MFVEHPSSRRAVTLTALGAWLLLNAVDSLLTWFSLQMGAVEANLFLSSIAALTGPGWMLLVKLLLAVSVAGIMWQYGRPSVWKAVNWGMVGVVVWNMLLMAYAL